jgi:hypothetical protein
MSKEESKKNKKYSNLGQKYVHKILPQGIIFKAKSKTFNLKKLGPKKN